MIEFKCSQCGKQLKVRDEAAGKKGKCPQCGMTLRVPEPELVTLEAAESSAATARAIQRAVAKPSIKSPDQPSSTALTPRKRWRWVMMLFIAAMVAAPFAPRFPLGLGIVLLGLCALAFTPYGRGISHRLFRLPPDHRWMSGVGLIMYGLIGLVLIFGGFAGAEYRAEQERVAAQKVAEEAEQRRLPAEANQKVADLAREAETVWQQGYVALAHKKVVEGENMPHATDLSPVRRLRIRMANAEVEALMAEATNAVKAGDVDEAKEKVQAALTVPHANSLAEARQLDEQIGNAADPKRIRAILMDLPDEAFQQLQENGEMPAQLVSGYEGLNSRTADLVRAQFAEVAAAREERRQVQIQRERVTVEAARRAAEAKRKEERKKRVESGFSAWDGSHQGLTKVIKAAMNDPKSYEHVETVYSDMGDHLVVRTTFRGKNAFGGVVPNWIKAKVDLNGNVLAIIEQGP